MDFRGLVNIAFYVIFFAVLAVFAVKAVGGAAKWIAQLRSPRRTLPAEILSRDEEKKRHSYDKQHFYTTVYYVEFLLEDGQRVKFEINGVEGERLTAGLKGVLTYRGDRFVSFVNE